MYYQANAVDVALRKESVDRNTMQIVVVIVHTLSLSARRAGIEIVITAMTSQISVVALRKESVDRNDVIRPAIDVFLGRSPQGERG